MAINISRVSSTRAIRPPRVVVVGESRVGKTTFAASAPNAVGILTEDGADFVDAAAFPKISVLSELYECFDALENEDHEFQTLFIDSLDWLEPIVFAEVSRRNGWKNIQAPGYGKGYDEAAGEWLNILFRLDQLRNNKNMAIILISHDKIKTINDPMHPPYDSCVMKLHDKSSALIIEWADIIGYAGHKIFLQEKKNAKENRAHATHERILHLTPHPSHCGGNRFGMSDVNFTWGDFFAEFMRANGVKNEK